MPSDPGNAPIHVSTVLSEEADAVAAGRGSPDLAGLGSWLFTQAEILDPRALATALVKSEELWRWLARRTDVKPTGFFTDLVQRAKNRGKRERDGMTVDQLKVVDPVATVTERPAFAQWLDGLRGSPTLSSTQGTINIATMTSDPSTWPDDVLTLFLNRLLEEPDLHERALFSEPREIGSPDTDAWQAALHTVLSATGRTDAQEVVHRNRILVDLRFPELVVGAHVVRTRDAIKQLYDLAPSALCLSGGGIRSATFGLGVLQGLAKKGLLKEFDYLSTVSGGGYIGSWLSSWLTREQQKTPPRDVLKALAGSVPAQILLDSEPPEIRHLRSYSNYLTPKLGLLSADTWTLIATYLRNLLVNWLVLVPLLLVVVLLPRLWAAGVRAQPLSSLLGIRITILTALILVGYIAFARPLEGKPVTRVGLRRRDRFIWFFRGQGGFLWFALLPLTAQAFTLCLFRARQGSFVPSDAVGLWYYLIFLVATLNLAGWVVYTARTFFAHRHDLNWRLVPRAAVEAIAAALAGVAAGSMLWWIALKVFPDPIAHSDSVPRVVGDLSFEAFVCFAPSLYLTTFFLQTLLFVGVAGKLNDDEDREWWARCAGWLLIIVVAWTVLAVVVFFGPLALLSEPRMMAALGGASGLVTLILGKSGASAATQSQKEERGRSGKLMNFALALAAPVFALAIIALLSLTSTWLVRKTFPHTVVEIAHQSREPVASLPENTRWNERPLTGPVAAHFATIRRTPPAILFVWGAFFLFGWFAGWVIHINRFSMHALYRNRLTRAFLGASRRRRHPHPFTGFDENDNLPMAELTKRPLHVVNVALNIVKGAELAWQQRKAEAFTISPLHCGSARLGYRLASKYAQGAPGHPITLGTAVAISGAAVSPNMGYHTSTPVSFLLTLFNVRLGWWLGNPGFPGQDTYHLGAPRSSLFPIISEAFGLTTSTYKWVYLSDGGHFDNLGLYEMARRRCRHIVVSDAGRDPEIAFEDLGNAIRKIRIDLGITITIENRIIYPRAAERAGKYYALGEIDYTSADGRNSDGTRKTGTLIYIKPAIYGNEPTDVYNYSRENLEFPHETTGDQWFSESQFESYRRLGEFVIEEICPGTCVSLQDFASLVQNKTRPSPTERLQHAATKVLDDLFPA